MWNVMRDSVKVMLPLAGFCLVATGCFSSSDDDEVSVDRAKSGAAAVVAVGAAGSMGSFIDDPNIDDPSPLSAANNDCPGTGHLHVNESMGSAADVNLDEHIGYNGDVSILEIDADCTWSEEGFSSVSRGYSRVAEAENGRVFFMEQSGGPGQSPNNSAYVSELESEWFDLEVVSSLYAHGCEGCTALGGGNNARILMYADMFMATNMGEEGEIEMHLRFGESTSTRFVWEATDLGGGNLEYLMDGFLGVSATEEGQSCDFGGHIETLDPMVPANPSQPDSHMVAGRVNYSPEGTGVTHEVVYNSDGSVTVDGETFTLEELEELVEDCSFEAEISM